MRKWLCKGFHAGKAIAVSMLLISGMTFFAGGFTKAQAANTRTVPVTETVTKSTKSGLDMPGESIYLDGKPSANLSANDYTKYTKVSNSYLSRDTLGDFIRVSYIDNYGVLVETYSGSYELLSTKRIALELPIFGGYFHSGSGDHYLIEGQDNPNDSDKVEVFRVIRYDSSFNRIGACKIYGANTYAPFKAGHVQAAELNGNLYVYTSHEMYLSNNYHHQSNATFVINQEKMTLDDSWYGVMDNSYGYVSHSFNQLIAADGDFIYRMDHGDAYPRGLYIGKVANGNSITPVSDYASLMDFGGEFAANDTGFSIGGMELSSNYILAVGNTVNQDKYDAKGQRNIILIAAKKDLSSERMIMLTNYAEGSKIVPRTPEIVQVDTNLFMVMWEEQNQTNASVTSYFVNVDGSGNVVSSIYESEMRLSDCQPICTGDGFIRWIASDKSAVYMNAVKAKFTANNSTTLSGKCGDHAFWTLNRQTGAFSVTGYGDMYGYVYSTRTPWAAYKTEIKTVSISKRITSIGTNAFYGCSALTTVTGCGDVTYVGINAFRNCTALTSVAGLSKARIIEQYAFCGSGKIATIGSLNGSISLSSCEKIGGYAFYECSALKTVKTYSALDYIGTRAFSNCTSLKTIQIGANNKTIASYAFCGCTAMTSVTCASGVTGLGQYAFYGCSVLKSVQGLSKATSVGHSAFRNCVALTQVGSVANQINMAAVIGIGDYGFSGCKAATYMSFGANLKTIGTYAFQNDAALNSLYLKSSKLAEVGEYALKGVKSTCVIYVPSANVNAYKSGVLKGKGQSTGVTVKAI